MFFYALESNESFTHVSHVNLRSKSNDDEICLRVVFFSFLFIIKPTRFPIPLYLILTEKQKMKYSAALLVMTVTAMSATGFTVGPHVPVARPTSTSLQMSEALEAQKVFAQEEIDSNDVSDGTKLKTNE